MKAVIICGGIGSKMWPLSRGNMPKHFAKLLGDKSLFQLSYETLRLKFEAKDIFIQTTPPQAELAQSQCPEIPKENIFIEPEMRNQGPATGFAAAMLKKEYGDEPFILIQADVVRQPGENFLKMVTSLGNLASKTTKYITAGVAPKTIVRGVDYLVKGKLVSEDNGVRIFEVVDYIDRSEEEKIKQFLGTDKLLIHTNHTTVTPNNLLKMFEKYKKEWYEPLIAISEGGKAADEYAKMPKGGLEEVTKQAYKNGEALVADCPFEWIDFGTWESLFDYMKKMEMYQPQDVQEIEAKNNFVRKPSGKYVAMIGVEDLVVVDTGDALLIMKKDQSGKVGQVVDRLKEEGRSELL